MTTSKYPTIATLLLAAGASRRMGQPKQLLKINATQTLIESTINSLQAVSCPQKVIVLGANAALIKQTIDGCGMTFVHNPNWEKGMGTSLQCGLQFLLEQQPNLEAALLSVCDQPYLTTELLLQLVTTYQTTQAPIIAAKYGNNKLGVPALLHKRFFPPLLALEADRGARKIIQQNRHLVATVSFPKGAIDLDTPEAYQNYLATINQ